MISYDSAVTAAQNKGIPVVEYGGPAAQDIRRVWQNIEKQMKSIESPAVIEV